MNFQHFAFGMPYGPAYWLRDIVIKMSKSQNTGCYPIPLRLEDTYVEDVVPGGIPLPENSVIF